MYEVPTSLSPSRVESFINCPLAFRFASIEKLPEPPTVATTRGSLVHRALELLFVHPADARTADRLSVALDRALAEYRELPEYQLLNLSAPEAAQFEQDCRDLTQRYLEMEDPTTVKEIGLELRLAANLDGLELRGIIDRLELDHTGELIVTDYKTGRAPGPKYQSKSLQGVHFYAWLCQEVLGQRPKEVRLMYLKSTQVITAIPTAQSVKFLTTRTLAVYQAVEKACTTGDFAPRQSALCRSCSFQRWCPAFGGDPARAAAEISR
jgi:putative RecB family exonuclease